MLTDNNELPTFKNTTNINDSRPRVSLFDDDDDDEIDSKYIEMPSEMPIATTYTRLESSADLLESKASSTSSFSALPENENSSMFVEQNQLLRFSSGVPGNKNKFNIEQLNQQKLELYAIFETCLKDKSLAKKLFNKAVNLLNHCKKTTKINAYQQKCEGSAFYGDGNAETDEQSPPIFLSKSKKERDIKILAVFGQIYTSIDQLKKLNPSDPLITTWQNKLCKRLLDLKYHFDYRNIDKKITSTLNLDDIITNILIALLENHQEKINFELLQHITNHYLKIDDSFVSKEKKIQIIHTILDQYADKIDENILSDIIAILDCIEDGNIIKNKIYEKIYEKFAHLLEYKFVDRNTEKVVSIEQVISRHWSDKETFCESYYYNLINDKTKVTSHALRFLVTSLKLEIIIELLEKFKPLIDANLLIHFFKNFDLKHEEQVKIIKTSEEFLKFINIIINEFKEIFNADILCFLIGFISYSVYNTPLTLYKEYLLKILEDFKDNIEPKVLISLIKYGHFSYADISSILNRFRDQTNFKVFSNLIEVYGERNDVKELILEKFSDKVDQYFLYILFIDYYELEDFLLILNQHKDKVNSSILLKLIQTYSAQDLSKYILSILKNHEKQLNQEIFNELFKKYHSNSAIIEQLLSTFSDKIDSKSLLILLEKYAYFDEKVLNKIFNICIYNIHTRDEDYCFSQQVLEALIKYNVNKTFKKSIITSVEKLCEDDSEAKFYSLFINILTEPYTDYYIPLDKLKDILKKIKIISSDNKFASNILNRADLDSEILIIMFDLFYVSYDVYDTNNKVRRMPTTTYTGITIHRNANFEVFEYIFDSIKKVAQNDENLPYQKYAVTFEILLSMLLNSNVPKNLRSDILKYLSQKNPSELFISKVSKEIKSKLMSIKESIELCNLYDKLRAEYFKIPQTPPTKARLGLS